MSATPPPSLTAAPTPAPQRGDRATFASRVDAFVTWLISAVTQFGALAANVYNNAVDAFTSATSAASSASAAAAAAESASQTAVASVWVSGTIYTQGVVTWSPLDGHSYRRRITGAGTIDPSADATNWGSLIPNGFTNLVVISSTQAWVAPAGATKAEVTVVDGGQGGFTNTGGSAAAYLPGGKGGNGGASILAITPAISYTATIGAGSASSSAPAAGGASSFSGSGITTLTSANAVLKVAGGAGEQGDDSGGTGNSAGGGTMLAPMGSKNHGAGGLGGTKAGGGESGANGVVIIRY